MIYINLYRKVILEVTVQLPMILLSKGTFDYIGNKDAAAFIIGEDFLNAYEKYELGSDKN